MKRILSIRKVGLPNLRKFKLEGPSLQRCISTRLESLPNVFSDRSHTTGQLSMNDVGKRVNLYGWVQRTRFNNKIIALRDSYGIIQCVLDQEELADSFKSKRLYDESVIKVSGVVRARPSGHESDKLVNGNIEISVDNLDVLNFASRTLPVFVGGEGITNEPTSSNRLRYRYLDLRSSKMQQALRLKSEVCHIVRQKLREYNFVECETPTLFRRTPGGANEFIVPTQLEDKFYSLVQSPQQLKQLLMIGGLDRYFQICRCYRDELGRSDRQPEFTQIDIELSFTNSSLIINLIDSLLHKLFSEIPINHEDKSDLLACFNRDSSLKKISFNEALIKYGSDKPDIRFDWTLSEKDGIVILEIPHVMKIHKVRNILNTIRESHQHTSTCPIELSYSETCMRLTSKDVSEKARETLGLARVAIAKELHNDGLSVYKSAFGILWVTDFPLFTKDFTGKLSSSHHPFTAPTESSVHLLEKNPLNVVGQHYDLIINGQEVAGGSIRIHNANLQSKIFSALQVDSGEFDYFLEALRYGCPPHGGVAIGLDRLIATIMKKETIRDVIAFPKSSSGRDLMTDSPHEVDLEVKNLYHIK